MGKGKDEDRPWWEQFFAAVEGEDGSEIDLNDFDFERARKMFNKDRLEKALKARKENEPKNLSMTLENLIMIVDGLQEQIILEKKALKKGKNKKYKKLRDERHKAEREIKENGNMDHVEKLRRWKYGI